MSEINNDKSWLRRLAGIGAIVGTLVVGSLATAGSAQAASDRDGHCDSGEFCYYYNSNISGSVSDFSTSISNLGDTQPTCYEFKGVGNGQGLCVKNNAASVRNLTSKPVTVYYNSGYAGHSQTVAPGTWINLDATLKNNNASHLIGTSTSGGVTGPIAVARAQTWVNAAVPYSMYTTRDGYRTDCSGYVSMAWGLARPGLATPSFYTVGQYITKDSLRQGDVLLNSAAGSSGHVVLFDKWANTAHTQYWGYEEHGGGTRRADHRVIPYPYFSNPTAFKPFHYNGLH